ncbi:ABC transporter substrate-binding protein [Sediminicola sp. 1XM1-17]|uniref:ABC transporter substrate-binding protein n=1 Tax=Sediminicola sp. 1XM1-17 TaxID=3127702 RepID=UPI00307808B2
MKTLQCLVLLLTFWSCKQGPKEQIRESIPAENNTISHAQGFSISSAASGVTTIKITSPWPNAEAAFTYALVPKEKLAFITLDRDKYDAIIATPIEKIVVTSTTHIPALEALGVENTLVGFPNTDYISSEKTRQRIAQDQIQELGNNEAINTEMVIALQPDLVVGFSIDNSNKAYNTIRKSNIPVVYNGDWTEETPLGKAEWIKFFAPFYHMEKKADSIFKSIETSYVQAKQLAKRAKVKPTVLSGALYKDVWYLPGGKSWASNFITDANANYLWKDTEESGSLSLSLESVLDTAKEADYWISPSQFTSYDHLETGNRHYTQFKAFKDRSIYTFANSKGTTGGLLYYELAPNRPDLVLKDLIHIFHPELLPEYQTFFFKPLE